MTNLAFNLNDILAKAIAQAPEVKPEVAPVVSNDPYAHLQEKYQASATTGQQRFYLDLCKRHKIEPQDPSTLRGYELYNLIEELKERPLPPTEDQLKKIQELLADINQNGIVVKPFSDAFLERLTGGRDGSASALIETLVAKRKEITDELPPSDGQLKILMDWMWCPDMPFEDYGITKKVAIQDEEIKAKLKEGVEPVRFMDKEEFKEEVKLKMKRREASAFIDKFRAVYYNWNKQRITKAQADQIRKLEMRLANIEVPQATQFSIDLEGNVIENTVTNRKEQYNPVAYDGMSEEALQQLSSQQASLVIDMLKSELSDRSLTKFPEVNDNSQLLLNEKRQAKEMADAKMREFKKVDDILYALEARNGVENMELHAMVNECILSTDSAQAYEVLQQVKEFMYQTIDFKNQDTVNKSIGALFTIVDSSLIMERLVEEIQAELKTA